MSSATKTTSVKTPCIGVCSTGIGDSVCRGCKRFAHEVIHWNGYTEAQRRCVMQRLETLLTQVVSARLEVYDPQWLRTQLQLQQVRFADEMNDAYLAYEALRAFGSQLPELAAIGCRAQPDWRTHSVTELKQAIDDAFFELSCAHYQRYFPGHL